VSVNTALYVGAAEPALTAYPAISLITAETFMNQQNKKEIT
jgi:hypothetical protein